VTINWTADSSTTADSTLTADGSPIGTAGLLPIYLTRTRRLLSDPLAQYWSDVELTDDINQARIRVAADTKCLRQIITQVPLVTGQELYPMAATLSQGAPANQGPYLIELMSVTIYWGNMRIKCQNRSFTEQDAKLRMFQSYTTRPGSLAIIGGNSCYLNPVPDQSYVSDWDVVLVPPPLVDATTLETIPVVFQPLIAFWAAHLAKYGEQSLNEADIFYKKYLTERQAAAFAFFSSRWRDAYRR
jgi:hypothetical protein